MSAHCSAANCGFRIFDDFAVSVGLVPCDDLVPAGSFTYSHACLNQYSFLDHVFIANTLKDRIRYFDILDEGYNTSDHLPVSFYLSVPPASVTRNHSPSDNPTKIRE